MIQKSKTLGVLLLFATGCGVTGGNSLVTPSNPGTKLAGLVPYSWVGGLAITGSTTGWSTQEVGPSNTVNNDGTFSNPNGMAIDSNNGFFYVVSSAHSKISKFNLATGAYIGSIGKTSASTGTCPANSVTSGWCTGGVFATSSADGGFNNVIYMALDPSRDFFYVTDNGNNRVSKYILSTGAYVGSIGQSSSSTGTCPSSGVAPGWCTGGIFVASGIDGALNRPTAIALDLISGSLFVGETTGHRVSKFVASTGAFVGAIGKTTASTGTCPASGVATQWCTGGTFATGVVDGAFTSMDGMAVDSKNGFLYVPDDNVHTINKFVLATGAFVGRIGKTTASTGTCASTGAASGWCTGGTFASGSGDGMYNQPYDTAVDVDRNILYIGDAGNNRVVQADLTTGAFIGARGWLTASTGTCPATGNAPTWCTGGTFASGSIRGSFNYPQTAIPTSDGYVYVIDNGNNRIVRITYNAAVDSSPPLLPLSAGLSVTSLSSSSISLSWNKSTDDATAQPSLTYSVYQSAPNVASSAFTAASDVKAGTLVSTGTNLTSATISSGILAPNAYVFNVVVTDQSGKETAYRPMGEFFSSNSLIYYAFDSATPTNLLVGGSSLDGTATNSPSVTTNRFGDSGRALNFVAASSQKVTSNASTGLTGTALRTLSLWTKSSSATPASTGIVAAFGDGTANTNGDVFGFYVTGTTGIMTAWLYNTADYAVAPVTNQWHFWAQTYDGTKAHSYLDGAEISNSTVATSLANGALVVGTGASGTVNTTNYYSGSIDDVRVYNTNLSAAQLAAIYGATAP